MPRTSWSEINLTLRARSLGLVPPDVCLESSSSKDRAKSLRLCLVADKDVSTKNGFD